MSWLTSVSAGNTIYQYTGFDGLGRVTDASQTTNSTSYPFHYTYNLADGIKSMTYPSGRVVTYALDSVGRVSAVSGQIGASSTNYTSTSSPITYAPQGAIASMTLGNGLIEQSCYNSQFQMVLVRQRTGTTADCVTGANPDASDVLHLHLNFPAAANNGNVAAQTITYGSKVFQQNYGYDGVNRLTSVSESGPGSAWSQTYGYDAVGNRWMSANSGLVADPFTPVAGSVYDSSNHMNGSNAQYVSGNQTQIGGYTFTYDAENRLTSSTINGGTANYSYDGEGHRVMKQSGGVTTVYVYDPQGKLAAEYTTAGTAPVPPCTTCYLMADHLGSTRMLTDGSHTVMALHDYLPFGQEIQSGTDGRDATWGGADPKLKFAGQERDPETVLDFFQARYFSGAQGRFTSADNPVIGGDPSDPQSWNLFAFGLNNPLLYSDPTGHEPCVNGVDPENGNICTVTTASSGSEGGPAPDFSFYEELLLQSFFNSFQVAQKTQQLIQQTQQLIQPILDWAARPRNPWCLAAAVGSGAMVGAGLGATPVVTIPITVPGGFLGGGLVGGAAGLIACKGNNGPSGSGGGTSSGSVQDKKLSPSEIKKLESTTGETAHQIKTEALGTNKSIAQYDLYKDSQGNVFVKGKGGVGEAIPTGLKIN